MIQPNLIGGGDGVETASLGRALTVTSKADSSASNMVKLKDSIQGFI